MFVGNIRTQESLGSDISCSSFSPSGKSMSAYEHSFPVSLRLPLRVGVGLYGLFIVWQSLTPAGTGGAIPHMDKMLHAIVYGLLAAGICLAWPKLSKRIVVFACIAFGGVLELVQGLMPLGRTASLWDGLANGAGAVLAIVILSVIVRKLAHQA